MLVVLLLMSLIILPWLCALLLAGAARSEKPDVIAVFGLLAIFAVVGYCLVAFQLFTHWSPYGGVYGIVLIMVMPLIPLAIRLEILRVRECKKRAKNRIDYR